METARELPRAAPTAWNRLPVLLFRALGIALAIYGAFLALINEVEVGSEILDRVALALAVAAGIAGALAWTAREARVDSLRLQDRLETVIRWSLGFIFITYGLAKIFRTQFPPASFYLLDQPVGDLPGIQLTWRFFGYSYAYACFVALSQIASSLLLFFRRTQLLGACLLLPVIGNIVFINFTHPYPPRNPRHRALRATLKAAVIVAAFLWPTRMIREMAAMVAPVETPVAGAWRVESMEGGPPMERAGQWEKIFFERLFNGKEGIVGFHEGHTGLTFAADPARRSLQFDVRGKPPQPPRKFAGTYELLPEKRLVLRGRLDGQPVRIELERIR
jgi:uncharacterized membrane protein YphA (DoxX/SURF4 family)